LIFYLISKPERTRNSYWIDARWHGCAAFFTLTLSIPSDLIFSLQIKVSAGHEFIVSTDPKFSEICDDKVIWVDYTNLPKVTAPGKLIYVDDGKLYSLSLLDNN